MDKVKGNGIRLRGKGRLGYVWMFKLYNLLAWTEADKTNLEAGQLPVGFLNHEAGLVTVMRILNQEEGPISNYLLNLISV